jgi:hypothetical protein
MSLLLNSMQHMDTQNRSYSFFYISHPFDMGTMVSQTTSPRSLVELTFWCNCIAIVVDTSNRDAHETLKQQNEKNSELGSSENRRELVERMCLSAYGHVSRRVPISLVRRPPSAPKVLSHRANLGRISGESWAGFCEHILSSIRALPRASRANGGVHIDHLHSCEFSTST